MILVLWLMQRLLNHGNVQGDASGVQCTDGRRGQQRSKHHVISRRNDLDAIPTSQTNALVFENAPSNHICVDRCRAVDDRLPIPCQERRVWDVPSSKECHSLDVVFLSEQISGCYGMQLRQRGRSPAVCRGGCRGEAQRRRTSISNRSPPVRHSIGQGQPQRVAASDVVHKAPVIARNVTSLSPKDTEHHAFRHPSASVSPQNLAPL